MGLEKDVGAPVGWKDQLDQTATHSSGKHLFIHEFYFHPLFPFTSHADVELLHNDVVLEVRIPPEVKTDPVAHFIIVKGLDLRETWRKV